MHAITSRMRKVGRRAGFVRKKKHKHDDGTRLAGMRERQKQGEYNKFYRRRPLNCSALQRNDVCVPILSAIEKLSLLGTTRTARNFQERLWNLVYGWLAEGR